MAMRFKKLLNIPDWKKNVWMIKDQLVCIPDIVYRFEAGKTKLKYKWLD